MNLNHRYILAFSLMLTLTACGGGGGSGNDPKPAEPQPSGDTTLPTATIITPSKSIATTSRTIEVSGSAEDLDSGIKSVSVNNIQATSEDNFANWTLSLPLNGNLSSLMLRAEDHAGNVLTKSYPTSLSLISELYSQASQMIFIPDSEKLIILDTNQNRLYETRTNQPNLIKLQNITFDNGTPAIDNALKMAYDKNNNQLIILDQRKTRPSSQAFIAINLANQKAKILKEGLHHISDFAMSTNQNEIFFFSRTANSKTGAKLSKLSVESQQIATVSDDSNSGPHIGLPGRLTIHNKHAYYVDFYSDLLVSVDLVSGVRILISGKNQNNLSLLNSGGLAINIQKARAWLTDSHQKQLISVNLTNGSRTIISSKTLGAGINFAQPDSIAYHEVKNLLYVSDPLLNIIMSVATDTGDRDYLISNRIGNGPLFESPIAIEVVSSELAFILDEATKSLLSVNLNTGMRNLISAGLDASQGPVLESPGRLTVDVATEKAWLTDQSLRSIIEVDLTTGQRTTINAYPKHAWTPDYKLPAGIAYDEGSIYVSDIYHDSISKTNKFTGETEHETDKILSDGAHLEKSTAIHIDKVKKMIYGVDQATKSIFEHNLVNSYSRIVSSNTKGNGISLESPIGIQSDGDQFVYISDATLNAILKVNVLNGNRDVLSNNSVGSGPAFKEVTALGYEASSQTLYVLDKQERALFSVNTQTGNRKLISR